MMREADIKAELINYLRRDHRLTSKSTLVSELAIGHQKNRVDLSLIDKSIHHFEIKSAYDSLERLDSQIESYLLTADFVSLAVSSKLFNAAISRVPKSVGLLEVVSFDAKERIRVVRPPVKNIRIDKLALLQIMPVDEICSRFSLDKSSVRRKHIERLFKDIDIEIVKDELQDFLRERYNGRTRVLLNKSRRRQVKPSDLKLLSVWSKNSHPSSLPEPDSYDLDRSIYSSMSESFGPVPDDVRKILSL